MKKKPAQELYTVRLMMLIICILIPMNVITIVLSILSVQGLVSRMRQNTQGTLEVYASQIDSNLKSAAVRSRYISTENQYFIYLDGQSSKKETNTDEQWHAVIKLFSEYQDYARENPIIGGLCAVFPGSGVQVIKDNRYSFSSDKESMQAYLDERIREERNLTRWECQKVGAHTRLFYLSKYRGSYSGAWFELDDMTRQIGIMDSEEMTLFTDAEGTRNDPGTDMTIEVCDITGNADAVKSGSFNYGDTSLFESFLPKGSTLTAAERTALLTGDVSAFNMMPQSDAVTRQATLTAGDAGWWCVDPDSGHVVVWTGTAWSE